MKYYAIIVAGGSGSRMESSSPKQFLLLEGKPVLMHTLQAFYACCLQPELILVLNIHHQQTWEHLCQQHDFTIPHRVVSGGNERFFSVKNGLADIKGEAIVAIHDAVRPLVSTKLILSCFQNAEENGNAVVGITPTDSVRRIISEEKTEALDRNKLVLIQTPQTFRIEQLKKAYLQPFRNEFTDDASVVERAGYPVHVINGERENIKITYKEDLVLASLFLQKKASE
ncbi:MAG: 2-C-methyl-D-erythritol 4-phosphate cytidylyltransferase [Pedobacter sp.]|nr:2-C-methyl-D-erythritol 4-phosphate cytidylyltransferase [Pedobacter sp.]